MRRRPIIIAIFVLVGGVVGMALLLAIEAQLARSKDYLPDPHYDIDALVPGAGPTIELAVAGDSTVAGLGADRIEDTLPMQIADRLARATGRAVHVVGFGVSGAVTKDVLSEQLPQVGKVAVLVIEIGSNDVTHLTRLDTLEHATSRMLDQARDQSDTVVLGSAGRIDTPNFAQPLRRIIVARSQAVRGRQARAAQNAGVGFVNMGAEVGDRFAATPGNTSRDGFHPAKPGYSVWADALAAEVASELG